MMKATAAMVASIAARRVLHAGWKLVTGAEPPTARGDQRVPLGEAVAWAALFGGTVTTSRLLASRYVSSLVLPRAARQAMLQQADGQGQQLPQPEAPGLPSLMAVAVLAWRRRR